MKMRLALVFVLAALPAQAGTVITAITTGSDVCPIVVGATETCVKIADADLARILAAHEANVKPTPTEAQVWKTMTVNMVNHAISRTQNYERGKVPIASIPATPQ